MIEVLEDRARQRLHVLLLQDHGNRHDHREVLGRALVVVLHREDGSCSFAHEGDLRRIVEELGVSAADVEAAERLGRERQGGNHEAGCDSDDPFHGAEPTGRTRAESWEWATMDS